MGASDVAVSAGRRSPQARKKTEKQSTGGLYFGGVDCWFVVNDGVFVLTGLPAGRLVVGS